MACAAAWSRCDEAALADALLVPVTTLFDTSVIVDYLIGDARARALVEATPHRAISVLSWVEVMGVAPVATRDATRLFLRSFERLAINEAIADEAAALLRDRVVLPYPRAVTWATARINKLRYVTSDPRGIDPDGDVLVPYRSAPDEPPTRDD
jgi:hypothetical protein